MLMLLIDGHNLIGKLPDLRLDDPQDEQKLVARLQPVAQNLRKPITVVFDPGLLYAPPQRSPAGLVRVLYASQGQTADRVIVGIVRKARRPQEVTVVTSDRELTSLVRAEGAQVLTSEAFVAQMRPPAPELSEEEERAEVHISKGEVDAWLAEFEAARQRRAGEKKRKRPKS